MYGQFVYPWEIGKKTQIYVRNSEQYTQVLDLVWLSYVYYGVFYLNCC